MSSLSARDRERLLELLADEQLDQLTPEDRAELDDFLSRAGDSTEIEQLVGEAIVAIDRSLGGDDMPKDVRARLLTGGAAALGKQATAPQAHRGPWGWVALAAALAITAGAVIFAVSARQQATSAQLQLASMQERIKENDTLIANAKARADALAEELRQGQSAASEQQKQLAEAAAREVELATKLASATANLNAAQLRIAMYEEPVDPATLQQNRTKLLEVPGTVRLAWAPFDLPEAPAAEQRNVTGDVVWNDELEQGYLRFVGLNPNDPNIEQYQVWIIDDRGMEQKVSGGVFNVTAQGEVIVPIEPGIDVGRVALFAITIEEPGGTWVPDLRRRVVLAPRG